LARGSTAAGLFNLGLPTYRRGPCRSDEGPMAASRYAHLSDAEINRHFMPRLAVPDHETWLAREAALSENARAAFTGARYDVSYGDTPLQRLDVFSAARKNAPIHIFVHGGFWRALDKSSYSHIGAALARAGATGVIVNYDLCPKVTVDDIVRQTMRAIAWVYRHGAELPGNPNRLFLSGHSVGAHLAAMALAHDWRADGLPGDIVKGVAALSGIFDLEPVLRIEANADIRLKPAMVARNSPLFLEPKVMAPVIVAPGGDEPEPWIQQSRDYAAMLHSRGYPVALMVAPKHHHFSLTCALSDPGDPLMAAMLKQMGL
jgi:arylformamidase